MEYKYKPGDVVIIRSPERDPYLDDVGWMSNMREAVGKEATIVKCIPEDESGIEEPAYYIYTDIPALDDLYYWYRECWLEPAEIEELKPLVGIEAMFGGDLT